MPRPGDPETGGPRPLIQTRVVTSVKARVRRRATAETDGNLSAIANRLIVYALDRMPENWDPGEDLTPTTTEEP
jgi:hypothetical protein